MSVPYVCVGAFALFLRQKFERYWSVFLTSADSGVDCSGGGSFSDLKLLPMVLDLINLCWGGGGCKFLCWFFMEVYCIPWASFVSQLLIKKKEKEIRLFHNNWSPWLNSRIVCNNTMCVMRRQIPNASKRVASGVKTHKHTDYEHQTSWFETPLTTKLIRRDDFEWILLWEA